MSYYPHLESSVSADNSTTTPLGIGASFTGTGITTLDYSTITSSVFTDVDGIVKFQFSIDNTNWDFEESFDVSAGTPFTKTVNIQAQYFRIVFENDGSVQSVLRLQTLLNVNKTYTSRNIAQQVDSNNTTYTAAQNFTGEWTNAPDFNGVMVTMASDASGTLYFDFYDVDGTTPTGASSPTSTFPSVGFMYNGSGFNEFHQAVKGPRWFRVRWVGDSVPTTLRINTYDIITVNPGNAPLNQPTAQDADSTIVKAVNEEFSIGAGLFSGYTKSNKLGKNPDIDTGTVPEDVWDAGGLYTGFPRGTPEVLRFTSTNAGDTGTVSWVGLKSDTSTDIEFGTITLNGTTPVTTTETWWRVHSAWYNDGSDSGFNAGDITIQHNVTTANIFQVILTGRSQTNSAGFTIPFGSTGNIKTIVGDIRRAGAGQFASGSFWIRTPGASPRLRIPFTLQSGSHYSKEPYGGNTFPAGTDIMPRITEVSANNTEIICGYDIVLIKD